MLRANFAARVAKIAAGASCSRAWSGYSAARRAQIEAECPDIKAKLDEIRRERMRPVHKDTLPEGCYLIQCETTGLVKIGYSNDPNDRLRTLRIGSPTKLVIRGVLGGGRDMEATLHARFAHRRSHGEWYALTSDELSETLCGSVVPEPGSYRAAKKAAAKAAGRSPWHSLTLKSASAARRTFAKQRSFSKFNAHLESWVTAVGYASFSQKELAALCGVTQGAVSAWLRRAGVKAQKRHFFDHRSFMSSVFNA